MFKTKTKIITFEGIDGSGKTTHIKKIEKYLKLKKIQFISFREPGGSKNAEKIRKLILNNNNNFDKFTDLLLYMASRNENMKMLEKYNKYSVILIDRFTHSSIAYQHFGMRIKLSIIKILNKFIAKNNKVDFTFLMVVSKKNLAKRFNAREKLNRYDNFKMSFYKKVQNGYLKMSKNNKKFKVINSNIDIKINNEIIIEKINSILKIQ